MAAGREADEAGAARPPDEAVADGADVEWSLDLVGGGWCCSVGCTGWAGFLMVFNGFWLSVGVQRA